MVRMKKARAGKGGEEREGKRREGAEQDRQDLFAVPIVVVANMSTASTGYLHTHEWFSKKENRVVVEFAGQSAVAGSARPW